MKSSELNERKYLLMTEKHGSIEHPMFWGHRTKDDQPRSWSSYTSNPDEAELYSMNEILTKFGGSDELLRILPMETYFGRLTRYTHGDWLLHENVEDVFVTTRQEALNETNPKLPW